MRYTLTFGEIEADDIGMVGGKGLNLGRLSRVEGIVIAVPPGFCVTTDAYREIAVSLDGLDEFFSRLERLSADDREAIAETSAKIRALFENATMPAQMASEIAMRCGELGGGACAVRSSATAEDLPGASFAGQQDTFLNVLGTDSILAHIRKCWASLFTDRAVAYRIKNGFGQRRVALSAVVQRMVFPRVSGIMFTADPVSGNRRVVSIDAGFGLGEALVSGVVSADNYRVRDGEIESRAVSDKKISIVASESGGTRETILAPNDALAQALPDERIIELAVLGRKIEAAFSTGGIASPQDIEWCLSDDGLHILQSRPITTLYPIPEVEDGDDDGLHVYVCANHMQMMTDAIRPLGLSFFEVLAEQYADIPTAGGRMFLDVSADLQLCWTRKTLLYMFGETDELTRNIVAGIADRPDIMNRLSGSGSWIRSLRGSFMRWLWGAFVAWWRDDVGSVKRFVDRYDAELREKRALFDKLSGEAIFDAIDYDIGHIYREMTNSTDTGFLILWLISRSWLRSKLGKWLDEADAVDTLSKSVPNNPTSEMGLALLDVSLVVRSYTGVVALLSRLDGSGLAPDEFFSALKKVEGGDEVASALGDFLEKYGMRCSGEIDITRPRWNEQPTALIPMIMNNVNNPDLMSGAERFEQGRAEAERKADYLLRRVAKLPGGSRKARKTKKMIDIWRGVSGAREYPKFFVIQCFGIYKKALLREADKLVRTGAIEEREDIYYLSLDELREAVRNGHADKNLIAQRREEYAAYEKLTPPRVMTSEGEILHGSYGKGASKRAPKGALIGVPVSSGVVQGTARVVLRQSEATVRPGDILVTPFTDPSWTPLFVSIKGLVTEVGGVMTHGAVITREYGLPAVVGVERATELIPDGSKIRLNGTEGWVEIL